MKFIGNSNHIVDWQEVIDHLETQQPAYIGPRLDQSLNVIGVGEISKKWKEAGLVTVKNGGSVGWDMFSPDINFDRSIIDKFADFVNCACTCAWISRVNPGKMVAWHWDVSEDEEKYRALQYPLLRFSCHMNVHEPGQVLVVDDHCIYNEEQGNVYQWPSRESWHGSANFGFKPKYLFNFFGPTRQT